MSSPVFGVIAPHPPIMVDRVGGSNADVTRTSRDRLSEIGDAIEAFVPDTVVLISPHAPVLSDSFLIDDADEFSGSLQEFGDSTLMRFAGDPELAQGISAQMAQCGIPCISRGQQERLRTGWLDHGSLVPLSFLDPKQRRALVVISPSFLPLEMHREVGTCVLAAAGLLGRRVVFLASGDLSHRLTRDAPAGFSPQAQELDEEIVRLVGQGHLAGLMAIDDGLIEAGGECGLRSIVALGGYCCDDPAPTSILSYEGPWGVGYLTALVGTAALSAYEAALASTPEAGTKGGSAGDDESPIVRLARASIGAVVRDGVTPATPELPPGEYPARAGAFVSLHTIDGALRGCIGTIVATHNTLAEEVVENAIAAATRDPRFPPVGVLELSDLDIKVDVLHQPESCSLDDLDPHVYGVITTSGWRRGLLLPDLEGVDDVEEQVRIAMAKAGIRPDEPCAYERFKVDRYT